MNSVYPDSVCGECNSNSNYYGIIVDKIITCTVKEDLVEDSSELSIALNAEIVIIDSNHNNRVLVIIDKNTALIEKITHYPRDAVEYKVDNCNIDVVEHPAGSTLLPGFIDCHVHLTIATDDYQLDHLRLSSADKTLRALKNAQGLLHAGFTTIRSAGDADAYYPSFAVARSIERGEFVGPRIVGAGHYISVTGGGGDINFLAADNCPCKLSDGIVADGKDQMVSAVRNEIKNGSDWIKLLVTGAFMSASTGKKDSPENTHFSPEELEVCIQEAGRRQIPVMAHAHGADGIVLAARSGCRSVEHASYIDQAGIDACLENNTWIVPTFSIGEYFKFEGSPTGAQERLIRIQNETNDRYYSSIKSAVKAGVKVALGSDFVGWNPSLTAREFFYQVELGGMTPLQSILSGTVSAAELLDLADPIGRVSPGFVADMVVVAGDPLLDISLLETAVLTVIARGNIVRGREFYKSCNNN